MIYREFMQPSSRAAPPAGPHSPSICIAFLRFAILANLVLFTTNFGAAQPRFEPETLGAVRKIFLEVEQTARMSARDQVGHLPRLYRAVCPQLAGRFLSASLIFFAKSSVVSITKPSAPMEELTADQRAAELEKMGGWVALAHGARTRCREIFERHRNQVQPLVEEDLRSESTEAVRRGLSMAGGIRLTALFDQVVDAFHDSEESAAAYALRGLGDTRAIPILIAKHPEDPTRYFEVLRTLQRRHAAHPMLLALLDSEQPSVRWRAAYALAESGDAALIPWVKRLARDDSPQVRRQAVGVGFSLTDEALDAVRPALVSLLSDPEVSVRLQAAVYFAQRQDAVCARALWELMKHAEDLEPWQHSNVVQAIHSLSGWSYFGFTPGTVSTPEVRKAALQRFARWIEDRERR